MARKQQSAPRASVPTKVLVQRLDTIRTRRLALEAQINNIEAQVLALQEEYQALAAPKPAPRHRRALRYPKT